MAMGDLICFFSFSSDRDEHVSSFLRIKEELKKKFVRQHEMVCCVSCGAEPAGRTRIAVVTREMMQAAAGSGVALVCRHASPAPLGKENKRNGKAPGWILISFLE
jgi:hypothetical protein